MFARFGWGLPRFLRTTLTLDDSRKLLQQQLRAREQTWLRVVEEAVFGNPGSPYGALFRWAGIEFGDLAALVRDRGLEGALEQLREAQVYVSLEEFKGRRPIERGTHSLAVRAEDFDSPLTTKHFEARTGGSRGPARRLALDLDLLVSDAAARAIFKQGFDLWGRPMAVWRPCPPDASGLKRALEQAKLGGRVDIWFSQNPLELWKPWLFTWSAVWTGRLCGKAIAAPRHTPLEQAVRVAHWLAEQKKAGRPALLETLVSSAMRVCGAARQHGLDIAGTFIRVGGEPLIEAQVRLAQDTGCRVRCTYAMSECGPLAMPCAEPTGFDDMHLLANKVAVIQRPRPGGPDGAGAGAFHVTTLLPSCPKIMLNVENGDYGEMEARHCGCPFGELGLRRHLHTIRSYEKLTTEGMHFLGSELLALVAEVLPAQFGGSSSDYQLVADHQDGLPKVSVVASPRLGPLQEALVIEKVLEYLGSRSGAHRMMAGLWRDGRALRVVRREPYMTSAAKVQALHVVERT